MTELVSARSDRTKTTVTGTGAVVAALGLQAALAATFALLSARWMGPSDRGVIVLTTTSASLLMLIGSLGAATGGRMLLSKDSPDYDIGRHQLLTIRLCAVHIVTMTLVGLPLLVLTGAWRNGWVAGSFVLYGMAMLAVYLLREAVHGLGRHVRATVGDVVLNVVLVLGVAVLHALAPLSVLGVTLLLLAAAVVEVCYLVLVGAHRSAPSWTGVPMSLVALIRLSGPALLAALAQAFVIRGDRLILGSFTDSESVGLYATAATFTELLWLAPVGLGQLAFRRAARGQAEALAKMRIVVLASVVALAAVGALVARPAVALLLGPEYAGSVPLVWCLLAASLPMCVYLLQAPILNGLGDFKGTATIAVTSAGLLLGLCVVLIPAWHAYGAVAASAVAYSNMAILSSFRVRNRMRAARAVTADARRVGLPERNPRT